MGGERHIDYIIVDPNIVLYVASTRSIKVLKEKLFRKFHDFLGKFTILRKN